MEETKTYNVKGGPRFILEKNGLWQVVNEIKLSNNQWDSTSFGEVLELGLDIKEISNQNITINVRGPNDGHAIMPTIEQLKKYAKLISCDYVSYQTYGDHIGISRGHDGQMDVIEVLPRLFIRYPNN